jgi:phosphoglycolate phosphatase-like HAD superfamily hydrolase
METACVSLNALGVDPEVGDSIATLAAAHCRVLGVGFFSGSYGSDELRQAGATRVCEDPADLLHHIDEMRADSAASTSY